MQLGLRELVKLLRRHRLRPSTQVLSQLERSVSGTGVCYLAPTADAMSAPSAPAKQAPPPPAKPTDSILLRHKRDAYYFSLTVFVCAYLLPLDEATAACAAGPTAGAQEFALQHGRWIATIVARNLAMCTIVYGGYHKIMYEGEKFQPCPRPATATAGPAAAAAAAGARPD